MTDQLAAGTPITDVSSGYTNYTAEQLEALEGMKDRAYTFGIARAEFANTLLLPDGSHSTDLERMKAAVKATLADILSGDTSDPKVLERATAASRAAIEVAEHITQKRFLFIVDGNCLPVIYFQCATPDNPESLISLSPHADDYPVLIADHPDPDVHAAQAAEVSTRIATVIADAKAQAKRGS
jgi:hypothetical protein